MSEIVASAADAGANPQPTVQARPEKLRLWCAGGGVLIVLALGIVAVLLPHSADGTTFHSGDQIAVLGVGLLIAGALWLPTRPRLRADPAGLHVRGIVGSYKTVPWTVVRSVEFRPRWQWARAVLPADETISLYAVQRLDGARSVAVMRALRELHAAAHRTP
jgi:Bacterial PH domain